ncbi:MULTISPECIES: hypothetical protein [unclassified Mesorhizobium]|uniref:hypothetical protein n=1 Tax=unclassified Mesorhizobium TaxID=325217 RepID=UPI00112CF9D1|nr:MULTISPECIES: hypothetical protein [unclassified Mesorhizobium]TPM06129.1 hypothetical protein FJ939_13595 [Mesorhizobium sp. B2-3-8]TPM13874.1 hypothetical protein FJ940_17805 [Mesorhizobium sp. B2-3-7]
MAAHNIVAPIDFARRMRTHWEDVLGNTFSNALEQLWQVTARTFNNAIVASDHRWRVLEPATGTGKTQGLIVYSAMMAELNAVSCLVNRSGILVVVRTIEQADEIVASINEMFGGPVAIARHSENKVSVGKCSEKDVLVITHSAYQRAVEAIYRNQQGKWDEFVIWEGGRRCLTIIDEAIANIVEHYQVKAQDISNVVAMIDQPMRVRHHVAVQAIESLKRTLEFLEFDRTDEKQGLLWRDVMGSQIDWSGSHSLLGLAEEVSRLPLDMMMLRKDSPLDRHRLAEQACNTLRSCENILGKWAYYHRSGDWDTINNSELLIPVDLPGPVVLDATASNNMLWELLGDRVDRPLIPSKARSYRNVRLHVAYANGLGKSSMAEKGGNRVARVVKELEKSCKEKSVLICLHKLVESKALALDANFLRYEVAHFGAIDGKNDWQDFDTAIILGLPYRGDLWAVGTFIALQGLPEDEWFASPSWQGYDDVRKVMEQKQITVSVVQAINRIRCRKVINSDGDCPSADIYIILPDNRQGASILKDITTEMPGINVLPWDFVLDGDVVKVRLADGYDPLISFMASRPSGETSVRMIKSELGWCSSKMKDLGRLLRDNGHRITATLAEMGVTFHHNGKIGRGANGWLLKA